MDPLYHARCRTCGSTSKKFSENRPGQRYPVCDACRNAQRRAKRAENPQKFRAAERANYAKHSNTSQEQERRHRQYEKLKEERPAQLAKSREASKDWHKRQREEHPEAVKAQSREKSRQFRETHPNYHREYTKMHPKPKKETHPRKTEEEKRAERKEYYVRYHQEHKEREAAYRRQNREREYARSHAWKQANPEKVADYQRRRIARKRNTHVHPIDYDAIHDRFGMWCYICGQDILPSQEFEYDHCIPVTRNGTHSTDNMYLAHKICNCRKAKKLLSELSDADRQGP